MSTNRLEIKIWESHYVSHRRKGMAIKCVRSDIFVPIRSAKENNDAAIKFLRCYYRKPDNNGIQGKRPICRVYERPNKFLITHCNEYGH